MIKTSAHEFKAFYNDPEFWPDGTWHEEVQFIINGTPVCADFDLDKGIPADAKVTIQGGVVFSDDSLRDGLSFETYFKRWRKKQSTVTLTLSCPKELIEQLKQAIVAAGGKVL